MNLINFTFDTWINEVNALPQGQNRNNVLTKY
jgi:hypothetical protein